MTETRALRGAVRGAAGTVVILSPNPIHDTGGGQRSAQIALELLERDFAVVFVSHGTVTETVDLHLRYDHPRLVRWSLDDALTATGRDALMEALVPGTALVVTQVPVGGWLGLVEDATRRGVPTVYDCIDRWDSELGRGWYRGDVEAKIAHSSSALTASAPALVDHLESLTGRETALIPNAYNAGIFDPDRIGELERPRAYPSGARVALYVGALWGGWMDWKLVAGLAAELPETTFVFVGDHRGEGRGLPGRCIFTGLEPQAALPAYLAHADVGFLPWRSDEVTAATSPLKVYEFVAMELPVVAPAIEPLRGIPGVRPVDAPEDFVQALATTDRDRMSARERSEMRRFAASSSWGERVERLLAVADERRGASEDRVASSADGPSTRPGRVPSRADRASISVVIPAYRHERWIGEALDSVEAQSLQPGEIVVVDDGSTDATAEIVEERAGRQPEPGAHSALEIRLVRQSNRGAHRALDRAIRLARGDWIAVLNSDDAYEPEHLENAWGVARETGAALVFGSVRLIDGQGGSVPASQEIARWYEEARAWAEEAGSLSKILRRHNVAVTTSNLFFHRELWRRLGGFRPYRYVHDYDFLVRAVELCSGRIAYEPSLDGVLYRVHEANTITERVEAAREERREMMAARRRPTERLGRLVRRWTDGKAVARAVEGSPTLAPVGRMVPESTSVRGPTVTVGLIVDSLGIGGLEAEVALLARSLPSAGFRTAVLCASRGGPIADRLTGAGVTLTVLGGAYEGIAEWVEDEGVLVASSHFAPVDVVSGLAAAGVPVVETVQNTYAWFRDADWEGERRRVERLAGVIAVSDVVDSYYREHTGRAADWIVPNAVHPARAAIVPRPFARRVLRLPSEAPVFAFVGRITEQKNPAGVLDAFARVWKELPDAILLLAGPADRSGDLARLRRRHASLFREGAVRLLSSPRHVGTVLSAADAYVSAAFYEGWSVAASEAVWVGRPLILTETGGSRELVGAESSRGLLAPNPCGDPLSVSPDVVRRPPEPAVRESVSALAEAMIDLTRQRAEWKDRRDAIRRWARRELAPEVITGRYAEILRAVIRGRRDDRL